MSIQPRQKNETRYFDRKAPHNTQMVDLASDRVEADNFERGSAARLEDLKRECERLRRPACWGSLRIGSDNITRHIIPRFSYVGRNDGASLSTPHSRRGGAL